MCATFLLSSEDASEIKNICDELTKKYGKNAAEGSINKDYYPKSIVPVVGKNYHVSLLKWGFPLKGRSDTVFNSRAESLQEKYMYKHILSNRCLVPATSFYEWDREKRKYSVSLANRKLFYMAGLWKEETFPDSSKVYYFTIITTEPNSLISGIHNRMPAILDSEDADIWLNGGDKAFKLLRPFEKEMNMIAV